MTYDAALHACCYVVLIAAYQTAQLFCISYAESHILHQGRSTRCKPATTKRGKYFQVNSSNPNMQSTLALALTFAPKMNVMTSSEPQPVSI